MPTKEEILAMLETEEGKAVLSDMGLLNDDQVKLEVENQFSGLIKKNKELLAKEASEERKNKYKKASLFDELMQSAGGTDDPANGAESLIQMIERAKNPGKSVESIEKERELLRASNMLEAKQNELLEKDNKLVEMDNDLKNMMVTNKTIQLLQNEGCSKIQAESVAAYILGKTQFDLIEDNGSRKAVNINGQSPEDFFNEWVKSEESNELLPAKNINRGAGASGSHSSGKPRDFKAEMEKASNSGDKASIIRLNREYQESQHNPIR